MRGEPICWVTSPLGEDVTLRDSAGHRKRQRERVSTKLNDPPEERERGGGGGGGGLRQSLPFHFFCYHSPRPVSKCKAWQLLNNKHVAELSAARLLDVYELCEPNVNDRGMAHLPKGRTVSHQRHVQDQVGHNPPLIVAIAP